MNSVTLTDAAVEHLKKIVEKDAKNIGFRLSVKKTGCSGFKYVTDVIEAAKENDIHFVAQQNLQVFVDPSCMEFMKELIIDYVTDELKQKRLVFVNPNEKNRCGCGESFQM